jgi:anti-sigma regulatory factor (Ser/Thr protein kinase)
MKQLFASEASQLAPAIACLQRFWEDKALALDAGYKFEVSLEEIFFNVVKHNTAASQISVDLSVADGVVTLVIEDDGSRFDPFSLSAVSIDGTIEERAVGGLGIHLVKEMMDSCTYAFIAEKNTATMSLAIEKVPDDAREKRRCD